MKKCLKKLISATVFALLALTFVSFMGYRSGRAATLPAPTISSKGSSQSTVTLKWKKVKGASGYKIYKYNSSKKTYKLVKTVKSKKTTITEITGLKSNTTYQFAVAAYVKKGKKQVVQTKSSLIEIKTKKAQKMSITDFYVYDSNDKVHHLEDYLGQPIIINLWTTWCDPCVQELPHFDKYYKKYGDKIKFFMINLTTSESYYEISDTTVAKFVKEQGYSFPIYFDYDSKALLAYGGEVIPITIIIDKNGKIVYNKPGAITETKLLNLIKEYCL